MQLLLHNPPNLNLPALKIMKADTRKIMEGSKNISNFVNSKLLLDNQFRNLFILLHKKSEEIDNIIDEFKKESVPLTTKIFDTITLGEKKLLYRYLIHTKKQPHTVPKKYQAETEKILLKFRKYNFATSVTDIKRRSSEIQNKLSKFEDLKNTNLDILTPLTLFICRNCKNLISKDRFKHSKCICGKIIRTISNTTKVPIAYFNKMLRNFITQNYWLEYGINQLLRKKNFQTLCGYHVLGHSGFLHEIDNIAESRTTNFRFFCECKTGSVKASDVFIFAGKMSDIGCSRGYIFTLEKGVAKEIVHLARSSNISIITGVLEKSESDLLKQIKE